MFISFYLNLFENIFKAYKYYGITGGRRFLRSPVKTAIEPNDDDVNLFGFFDNDDDKSAIYDRFKK
jgi:hypothetical protein